MTISPEPKFRHLRHNTSSLTDGWTAGSIEEKENGDLINQKLDQVFLVYRLARFAFAAVCMVAVVEITGNTLLSVAVNTKCSPININASNWSYMTRGWDALPALWVLTQFGEQWPSLICVYVWYFITTTAFALLDMSIAIVQQQYNPKLHVHGNTPNSFTCRVSLFSYSRLQISAISLRTLELCRFCFWCIIVVVESLPRFTLLCLPTAFSCLQTWCGKNVNGRNNTTSGLDIQIFSVVTTPIANQAQQQQPQQQQQQEEQQGR